MTPCVTFQWLHARRDPIFTMLNWHTPPLSRYAKGGGSEPDHKEFLCICFCLGAKIPQGSAIQLVRSKAASLGTTRHRVDSIYGELRVAHAWKEHRLPFRWILSRWWGMDAWTEQIASHWGAAICAQQFDSVIVEPGSCRSTVAHRIGASGVPTRSQVHC